MGAEVGHLVAHQQHADLGSLSLVRDAGPSPPRRPRAAAAAADDIAVAAHATGRLSMRMTRPRLRSPVAGGANGRPRIRCTRRYRRSPPAARLEVAAARVDEFQRRPDDFHRSQHLRRDCDAIERLVHYKGSSIST